MDPKQRYSAISVVALGLTLAGCATGPVEVDALSFETVPLERAQYMPSQEEIKRGRPRVAILPLELRRDQSVVSSAAAQKLEPALRSELEKALLESGKVEVLDRNMAMRLQGALAEYEERKGTTPKPFQQADYLLIGQVDLTSATSEYKEATVNSKGRTLPGICVREGNVSGVLKVYDLLENTVKDLTEIKGRERDITQAPACTPLSDPQKMQLYQQATQDAVSGSRKFLRKFFSPTGYIAEKRTNGKVWTFKVSTLGSAMSEYKTVKILERRQTINGLTDDMDIETLSIGEARITDQSGPDFIWILVADKKTADRIKLGNIVRPDAVAFKLNDILPSLN